MNDEPNHITDLARVQARRREIAKEVKDAMAKVNALKTEDSELETAERVILRLSKGRSFSPQPVVGLFGEDDEGEEEAPSLAKPPNTPTVPEMIKEALMVNDLLGDKPGLEPKEMANFIAEKWWPNVPINAIGPIAWRMWKRHELVKKGSVYSLPANKTPAED